MLEIYCSALLCYSECGWIETGIYIYEVESNVKNRRTFRTIARDICGESMEPSDPSMVLFGDIKTGIFT